MDTNTPFRTVNFAHPKRNISALGIQGGMQIADFGSGSGAYVLAIAERLGNTGRVYAIDVQKDLLRRTSNEAIRQGHHNVDVIWTDLEIPNASKLANQSMDLVLISNLLFQVPDKLPVLREARRIVKPGGTVAVIDWNDSYASMGPRVEDVMKKEAAIEFAARAALEPLREFYAGSHHWGVIFRPTHLNV